jgi:hypothetical protein
MLERPLFPGRALLGWLTVNAHLIVVGALFGAFKSPASKLGIAGVDASGIFIITAFFLGRLYEWNRFKSHSTSRRRSAAASDHGTRSRPEDHRRARAQEQAA